MVVIVLRVVVEYLLIFVCLLVQLFARHMHHGGHSSEGSCRVLTDICVPSGAIICQAHASWWS